MHVEKTLVGRGAVARASARKAGGKPPQRRRAGGTRLAGGRGAGPVGVALGLYLESRAQRVGRGAVKALGDGKGGLGHD